MLTRRSRFMVRLGLGGVLGGLLLPAAGCNSGGANVVLEYVPQPTHPQMIESDVKLAIPPLGVAWTGTNRDDRSGMQSLAWTVTVQNDAEPARQTTYTYTAGTGPAPAGGNRSAALWQDATRGRLASLFTKGAEQTGKHIQIVDRDHLHKVLSENDLEIAGIVDGGGHLSEKAKQLPIDGFIFGQVDIHTTVEYGQKDKWYEKAARYTPVVGGYTGWMNSSKKQEVRRIITLNGRFQLTDRATGKVWLTHAFAHNEVDTAKPPPFIGGDKQLIDMKKGEEEVIARLLEYEAQRFVSRLLPVRFQVPVKVAFDDKNEIWRAGVRDLQTRDYAAALAKFEQVLQTSVGNKDALFCAALAAEALGRLQDAKNYLSQVGVKPDSRKEDDRQIANAFRRVQDRLDAGETEPPGTKVARQTR